MTASHDTKACAKCGAQFKRSRHDATVNCPGCRQRPATGSAAAHEKANEWYIKAGEARKRGYAARDAGDQAAYEKAVGDFQFCIARRDEYMAQAAA